MKKYQNNLLSITKFRKGRITFEEVYNSIKGFFNGYNNDNESMIRLINDISMFNIGQIYSFKDFFLNKALFNLNKNYESNKDDNLIFYLINDSSSFSQNKKKKKKNKKRRKNKKMKILQIMTLLKRQRMSKIIKVKIKV